ncbi:P-loop containing nucleoside triphosphate hydrolase protein [Xylaria sp. CBS 124048]|nr:P-loop containing nucleoside triphosphate hydrolase protein [Xylaria sp. CBS 124048]
MTEGVPTNRQVPLATTTTGSKCAFKTYHKIIEDGVSKTKQAIDPFPSPFSEHDNQSDDIRYALVIRKTFQHEQRTKVDLTINSPQILNALRDVVRSYEPVASDFNSPLTIQAPFGMLLHYWDALDEYRRAQRHKDHLDLLFRFMEQELKPDRDHALELIRKGQVEFNNAWVIYRPGSILYREFMGEPWLLVCREAVYGTHPENGPFLEIHAMYTDHNGSVVGDAAHIQRLFQRDLSSQDSHVAITELPIYPRRFAQIGDSLERRLKLRGEKFLDLKDFCTFKYDGVAERLIPPSVDIHDALDSSSRGVWLPYIEAGRVVIDRKTFAEENQTNHLKIKLADPKPWLCPPFTLGYSLGRQQWAHLLVDKIHDAEWKPSTWDALILPEKQKGLLRSLVVSHQYSENPRDRSPQKGRGLVILSHGTPGTGKTLTVEAIAEVSKKAILSASIGELRNTNILSDSRAFETELRRLLQYATIWQAIVLFDEADIVGHNNDVDRNALVAKFIRELEFFSGIAFLTMNRVNSLDMATRSRIHLVLRYETAEADDRRQIWKHYLKLIPEGQLAIKTHDAVNRLALAELNGREIANTVNTAFTIARFEGQPLALKHVEAVLETRQAFDDH